VPIEARLRHVAADEDRLAEELASLRLDRPRAPASMQRTKSHGDRRQRSSVVAWILAIGALLGLGVGGFFVYREGTGRLFSSEVELGAVTLMSPAQSDVTLVATGYVFARHRAVVAPRVPGRIAKLLVAEGAEVKAGQLVAELESADAQASLMQVRADIAAAKAKVERAAADVSLAQTQEKRERELLGKGAGVQATYDDAKARLDAAQSMLRSAESDVRAVEARRAAAEVLLDNTKIRAPFNGTITKKLSEVGEVSNTVVIGGGGGGVFAIASLDDLEVQADVAEAQVHKVKMGTPAEIILDAFPERRFRGQVSELGKEVDRAKAALTVKVRFVDEAGGVLPDMAAKVSFLGKALDAEALKAAPKLVAPSDAIVQRDGQTLVFTLDGDHARMVPVTVRGPFGSGMVELASGPDTGTRVIRRPDDKIRDGVAVKERKK
jgi:RND family efflux transporter MFP subunit